MYKILPYNFHKFENKYLLSNLSRDFLLVNESEFEQISNKDFSDSILAEKLLRNHYIYQNETELEEISDQYRYINEGLFKGPFLHIFVLSLKCNLNCRYCQAELESDCNSHMTKETAEKAVDVALQSPYHELSFEFQGGEPLLNYEVLQHIVEYTVLHKGDKKVKFSLVTNAESMNEEILEYLIDHNVGICLSLDGPKYIHDKNRPTKTGKSNYDSVMHWYNRAKEKYVLVGKPQKVTVLPTITRNTLPYYKEFIDFFAEFELDRVSIRNLSPYGRSGKNHDEISYSTEEYLDFYKKAMDYLIEVNLSKKVQMIETYSGMYLAMIVGKHAINFTDLRSPCGATIAQIAYNWNGNIYTCDEGRMMSNIGIEDFKVGNVFDSTLKDCILSENSKTICSASCNESNSNCVHCVYHCICGICPVYTSFTQGNFVGTPYKQDRCKIHKGVFEYLLKILLCEDSERTNLLKAWGE